MGGSSSQLNAKQLTEYEELTYLSKNEILRAEKMFYSLWPSSFNKAQADNHGRLPPARLCAALPLRANPFADRFCRVFSTSNDGLCSFDDFLDLLSALHPLAPTDLRAESLFKVLDFDEDGVLGIPDLQETLKRITCGRSQTNTNLTTVEQDAIIERILQEADLNADGVVSLAEFLHMASRIPDFPKVVQLRV